MHNSDENKPIVLTFARYYWPGYKSGGQLRTLVNMVERLGYEIDFRLVTSDRDLNDPKPYESVKLNQWNRVGKATGLYLTPHKQKISHLLKVIKETNHDLIYLNSFFDPVFTIIPLLLKRLSLIPDKGIIIAPRGELSMGALKTKNLKKMFYLALTNLSGLYNGLCWQASSEFEAQDIQRVLNVNKSDVIIAPDIPGFTIVDNDINIRLSEPGKIKIVYLSRISPIKNLIFALQVLQSVKSTVAFDLYGPIDDAAYWEKCKEMIKALPDAIKVDYKSYIEHEKVSETLGKYDLFFLPTLSENYGHVIHEALAAGLPVLISDLTPWRNLENSGIGWDLPLNKTDRFVEIIESIAYQDRAKRLEMRNRAVEYANKVANDQQVVKKNRDLFFDLLT